MVFMMINNGGGLFTPDGKLDVLNERNVEAIDFILQLVKAGISDPASVSYTNDNHLAQWKNKKFAFGIYTAGLDQSLGEPSGGDLLVASPLTGPHGDKASLAFGNNIMMYTNTPSQAGSEAFLDYYIKNMKTYWQQGVVTGLPVLQSIVDLPEFQKSTTNVQGDQGVPADREDLRHAFHGAVRGDGPGGRQPAAGPVHPDGPGRPDRREVGADDPAAGPVHHREVVT